MHIGIIVTHIRAEEKLLIEAFRAVGCEPDIILDRDVCINLTEGATQIAPSGMSWQAYALIIERCVSTSRGLYLLQILNAWGIMTINSYQTASICADKAITSLQLALHNIPQPEAYITFSEEQALNALEQVNYPAVIKPTVGSWGRLVSKVNDKETAETILEHRQTLGNYLHQIHYIQEYVNKPQRDIRAFVLGNETICAIYRHSDHWITNTARGGKASNCPVTAELDDLCVRSAQAVGGGVLAIDILETETGQYLVNEINHTMEFRNSSIPTGVNIAHRMVEFAIAQVRISI